MLRNVSALTGTPPGREGRPSRSMTLPQATALTAAAKEAGSRTHAYITLPLCTGVRTEEARALQFQHLDFGGPASVPPRSADSYPVTMNGFTHHPQNVALMQRFDTGQPSDALAAAPDTSC